MAPSFGWSNTYSQSSPTLLVQAQHPPSFSFSCKQPMSSQDRYRRANGSPMLPDITWAVPTQPIPTPTPAGKSLAGRKRSRDELADAMDDDGSSRSSTAPFPSTRPSPSPPKREAVMGPGMTLVYPDDASRTVEAASQTGTWAEELAERLRSSSFADRKMGEMRPALESRKSMRLDGDAPGLDDVEAAVNMDIVRPSEAPAIDQATLALGIGWATIPSTETMDAACRGWARFIEGHFPLTSARVVWQNKTLPAYLVSAVTCESNSHWRVGSHGYYLFDETLMQGRLIARDWTRALDNLRLSPIVFEGDIVMNADPHAKSSAPKEPVSMTDEPLGMAVDGMEIDL